MLIIAAGHENANASDSRDEAVISPSSDCQRLVHDTLRRRSIFLKRGSADFAYGRVHKSSTDLRQVC